MCVAGCGNADAPEILDVLLALDNNDRVLERDRFDDFGQVVQDRGVDEPVAVLILGAFDPSVLAVGPLDPESFLAVLVVGSNLAKRGRAVGCVIDVIGLTRGGGFRAWFDYRIVGALLAFLG